MHYADSSSRKYVCTIIVAISAHGGWKYEYTIHGQQSNSRCHELNLIESSFSDADKNKCHLLQCFPHYRAAINILRKDTTATEEEICVFQDHIDSWFRDWVQVFGKEGCTNYTHMLSSSHVMRYMPEWRCLNRFSQQ